MGLMFRHRRPVARLAMGAATAGVAYHAGKKNAQQQAVNEQAQEAYQATQAPPQYAPPPPAPAPAAAPATGGEVDDLNRLVDLHTQGVLSDEEFAAAKAKLLSI